MRTIHDINPSKIDHPLSRVFWEVVVQKFRQYDAGLLNLLAPGNYPTIDPASPTLDDYLFLPGRIGGQIGIGGRQSTDTLSFISSLTGSVPSRLRLEDSDMIFDAASGAGTVVTTVGVTAGTAAISILDNTSTYAAGTATPSLLNILSTYVPGTNGGYLAKFSFGNASVNSAEHPLWIGTDYLGSLWMCGNSGAGHIIVVRRSPTLGGGTNAHVTVTSTTNSATNPLFRMIPHATQTADIWQIRNSGNTQSRVAVDSSFRLALYDADGSDAITLKAAAVTTAYNLILPAATGTGALYNDGTNTLAWASLSTLGAAANTEPFVTIGNTAGLTSERALTGTANQITITDGGAGSGVTLSTPQNLDTAAVFRVGTLGIGAAAAANIALDVTGSMTLRATTEAQLVTSPTAYAIGIGTFIRQDASGVRQIKGIAGGADGRLLLWRVTGTQAYQFNHEDAAATAANRIHSSSGINVIASLDQIYPFIYDATTARWILQKWAEPGGTETITGIWTYQNSLQIDMGFSAGGGQLILYGASGGAEPYLTFKDATTGFASFLTWGAVSAPRNLQLPDADDILVGKATTDNFTNKTSKASCVLEVSTSASGVVFQDATTSTKKLRLIISGAAGTSTWTLSGTAARDYAFDSDFSCRVVSSGNTAVAAGAAVAAGSLGKHDSTGNTVSVAATTIGKTVTAGMYKVHWYIKVTTAGDVVATDNLTVTIAWNDGTAQSRVQDSDNETAILSTLPVSTLNRAFSGDQTIYCAAATDVTVAAALINGGVTNPVFDFRARLEAL